MPPPPRPPRRIPNTTFRPPSLTSTSTPRPTSFTIFKMLYSLRRGHLPSLAQLAFSARQLRHRVSALLRSSPVRFTTRLLFISPLLWFLADNTLELMWVTGPSMSPFFNNRWNVSTKRDAVLVNKWRQGGALHRGDVVAFWTPGNAERMAVKRVVAVEGDEVKVREEDGRREKERRRKRERQSVLVGRQAGLVERDKEGKGGLEEKGKIEEKERQRVEKVVVPQGHIWIEGDNVEGRFSHDSNNYGPISRNLVVGKVIAGVWPAWAWVRWQDWRKSDRVREGVVEHEEKVHSGADAFK